MKLTQIQLKNIYYLISAGFSQRSTAEHLGHSRGTIARYLKPKEVAEHIMDQYHKIADTEYEMYELENKVFFYRNLAILGYIAFIGFMSQVLINILF